MNLEELKVVSDPKILELLGKLEEFIDEYDDTHYLSYGSRFPFTEVRRCFHHKDFCHYRGI